MWITFEVIKCKAWELAKSQALHAISSRKPKVCVCVCVGGGGQKNQFSLH
jgi:hypothetical protein